MNTVTKQAITYKEIELNEHECSPFGLAIIGTLDLPNTRRIQYAYRIPQELVKQAKSPDALKQAAKELIADCILRKARS